jgi:monoterpene epsilon-lactone hydrolase
MSHDLSYQELKKTILSSLDISSTDISSVSTAFSKLYSEFQTDAVHKITVTAIPNTCLKWISTKESNINKVLIFLHGGGYTMGSTQDHLELIARLVLNTRLKILSVDYRLTPENHYPAPLDDVMFAYKWLVDNGYHYQDIAISGISAGGLLVTQFILQCQQEKLPLPKVALVMSGPCNLRFELPSIQYNADRDWISLERLQHIPEYYLPKNSNLSSPELSPIDANYTAFPITLFQAGDYEMLLDDTILFYQKLRQAKFDVFLNVVSGLPHCWQLFSKVYAPGRLALHNATSFLNNVFC